jgi:outer membrane lipoprotein carrier protein
MSLVLDSVVIALLSLFPAQPPARTVKAAAPAQTAPAAAEKPAAGTAKAAPATPAAPAAPKAAPAKPAPAKPAEAKPEAAKADATAKAEPARQPMAPEVKDLVDRMQAFYERTEDFTSTFKQDYTYKAFKRTQSSSGKVTFKKPALMRWEYEKPAAKTFVLAGEKVYAYDPEARTLTKASIGTNQLSASVTFLWGRGRLADEFAIARIACDKCQGTLLELTPYKPDPRFRKARLEVDPKSAQVLRSIVIDPDGSENAITFAELKTNQGIAQDFFKLTPPEGTEIVDLTKQK